MLIHSAQSRNTVGRRVACEGNSAGDQSANWMRHCASQSYATRCRCGQWSHRHSLPHSEHPLHRRRWAERKTKEKVTTGFDSNGAVGGHRRRRRREALGRCGWWGYSPPPLLISRALRIPHRRSRCSNARSKIPSDERVRTASVGVSRLLPRTNPLLSSHHRSSSGECP